MDKILSSYFCKITYIYLFSANYRMQSSCNVHKVL